MEGLRDRGSIPRASTKQRGLVIQIPLFSFSDLHAVHKNYYKIMISIIEFRTTDPKE